MLNALILLRLTSCNIIYWLCNTTSSKMVDTLEASRLIDYCCEWNLIKWVQRMTVNFLLFSHLLFYFSLLSNFTWPPGKGLPHLYYSICRLQKPTSKASLARLKSLLLLKWLIIFTKCLLASELFLLLTATHFKYAFCRKVSRPLCQGARMCIIILDVLMHVYFWYPCHASSIMSYWNEYWKGWILQHISISIATTYSANNDFETPLHYPIWAFVLRSGAHIIVCYSMQ